jgi:hypothetical protein
MTPAVVEAAQTYLRAGFSVIPTQPGDKRPCIPWKRYQEQRPTEEEVRSWYRRYPSAGVAVVCGSVSGLVVVDFDPRNGDGQDVLAPRLPETPSDETGGGGRHCYFGLPPGLRVPKVPALLPGVDLQAEGAYVIAPPTIHLSGRPYRWLPGLAIDEVPMVPLPPVVLELLAWHRALAGAPTLAGHLTARLNLDGVLARLSAIRRSGHGWVARCPAHDDQEPSLSIGRGVDGRALLHCFAGCTFREVRRALAEKAPR